MFRLPRLAIAGSLLALLFSPWLYAATVDDVTDGSPYFYQAAAATLVAPGVGGAKLTTDSGINHLPVFHGHVSTNDTYRFVNVAEQVITIIGDGKHGLWRIHENGHVREYLNNGAIGVTTPADDPGTALDESDLSHPDAMAAFVAGLTAADIGTDYSHKTNHPTDSFAGFKTNASLTGAGTAAQFLDIPISHARYAGAYDTHVPIDLPGWYCTMSANNYRKARAVMDFAFAQPAAGSNNVGPLGQRAGLDVSQNYTKILRLHSFGDAQTWANTGSSDAAIWRAIQLPTKSEIYFVERPFFDEFYLFIVVVFDNGSRTEGGPSSKFSYIRPNGAYYDHLQARAAGGETLPAFNTTLRHQPRFSVRLNSTTTRGRAVSGTRLYGIHHPGFGIDPTVSVPNGACPSMGGDFGENYYGASWPTTYQEATPLCDGILVDIKLFANLDGGVPWNDKDKNLANNTGSIGLDAINPLQKNYSNRVTAPALSPGNYGVITDPYLLGIGYVNPEAFTATGTDTLLFPSANDQTVSVEP